MMMDALGKYGALDKRGALAQRHQVGNGRASNVAERFSGKESLMGGDEHIGKGQEPRQHVILQNLAGQILKENPLKNPPPYEKLVGDISGAYSRRINIHHRLVYQILEDIRTVKVIRMWTHYE